MRHQPNKSFPNSACDACRSAGSACCFPPFPRGWYAPSPESSRAGSSCSALWIVHLLLSFVTEYNRADMRCGSLTYSPPTTSPPARPPARLHPRYSAAISGIAVPHTEWQNSRLKMQSLIKNTVIKDSSKVFLWLEHFPVSSYRTGTNHALLCKRDHPQPSHVVERTA